MGLPVDAHGGCCEPRVGAEVVALHARRVAAVEAPGDEHGPFKVRETVWPYRLVLMDPVALQVLAVRVMKNACRFREG
jgi:hypothetical protein